MVPRCTGDGGLSVWVDLSYFSFLTLNCHSSTKMSIYVRWENTQWVKFLAVVVTNQKIDSCLKSDGSQTWINEAFHNLSLVFDQSCRWRQGSSARNWLTVDTDSASTGTIFPVESQAENSCPDTNVLTKWPWRFWINTGQCRSTLINKVIINESMNYQNISVSKQTPNSALLQMLVSSPGFSPSIGSATAKP